MITRQANVALAELSKGFPIVSIMGPRQSGKTTLARAFFPDFEYFSLEDLDVRAEVTEDPRGFLQRRQKGFIVDEAQHAPGLFSYLQGYADQAQEMGRIVLTGSQNFLLMERVTQSLAGRVGSLDLLPFSWKELSDEGFLESLDEQLFKGGYPPIYDREIAPEMWYPRYVQTYIDRDVRTLRQVADLASFQKFLRLCAGRIGQLLNFSSLGNECGVDAKTAQAWLSVLETSYVVFRLPPFHRNFNKRIVKQAKLYFYDTGLACTLLGLEKAGQLESHYMRGALFENAVILEKMKHCCNAGRIPKLFFFRDHCGREIDLIEERADGIHATEVKSGATLNQNYFENLRWFAKTISPAPLALNLIYGGERHTQRGEVQVKSWKSIQDS
jgi:predicted AAA+ superfamily ATPase